MGIMQTMEQLVNMIENMLNNKRKRHIIGGALLSASFFFGGLAVTTIFLKTEEIWKHLI